MVCSGKLVNYLYLYTGTSIILKYMHNTNNNNTVYEDITLWSTERSCGVQARGVTTPKSTHQYPCIRRLKRACGPPPSIHASAGAEPTLLPIYSSLLREKNSVKTHKFMNLCDFTNFFVKNQSNLQDLPPILNGYLWGNTGENSEKNYIILFVWNPKTVFEFQIQSIIFIYHLAKFTVNMIVAQSGKFQTLILPFISLLS